MTRVELLRALNASREWRRQTRIEWEAKVRLLKEEMTRAKAEAKRVEKSVAQEIPAELELLRKENRTLRQKHRVGGGMQEIILATVKELLQNWDGKLELPTPVRFDVTEREEVVALAHVTDVQLGKTTASYSTEIAEGRLMEYARKVAACCHVHHKMRGIRELRLYLGGDIVEGETVFPKQGFSIDSSVMEQAVKNAPRIISAMIMYWSSYFEKIHVVCVRGNHGRPGSKHDNTHPDTNWDSVSYLCAKQMTDFLMQLHKPKCKVTWNISLGWYAVDDLLGHKNLLIHGDLGIRGGFAGVPFYGITRAMAGWLDTIPEPWDHCFIGHFHQFLGWDWNGHMVFMGGTPESDNEFARAELASGGRPKQRMQLWTRKNGPIVDLPIQLNYEYERRTPYSQKRRVPEGAI